MDIKALAMTLVVAGLAGSAAHWAHLPLGYLLGALVATGVIAALGLRPLGRKITLPPKLRFSFVPVIGVAIGGAFTPEVAGQILTWGPSLLALLVFVPVAHAVGYVIFRWGGLSRQDAVFGAVPGGLIESVQAGEDAGADVRLLTVLQFLRLILTIVTVPLIFWALTGHAVGSASGAALTGANVALGPADVAILVAAGGAGAMLGRQLRLPGWIITGPLLGSALVHGLGWVQGVPPAWLIALTQIILGAGLGARFEGVARGMLIRAGRLAVLNGIAALILAFVFAGLVHLVSGQPVVAAFLAFAPGGLAEMSLIALSLQVSVIYVTAHHVVRIVIAVSLAKLAGHYVFPRA